MSQYEQMEIKDLIIKCVLKKRCKTLHEGRAKIECASHELLLREEPLFQCEKGNNLAWCILLI